MPPDVPGQVYCPECGKPMGPGMRLCPPCTAARRRQQQTRKSREFNPWVIFLGALLAGVALLAFRFITVTIPHMKAGRAINAVQTHDIMFYLNKDEKHYSIEQVITHYNPATKVFKPDLLPIGMKPEDPVVWSAKLNGAAYDVVCRFRGAVYSFMLAGGQVQGTNDNGLAILDQENAMIDSQLSYPSSVGPGAL
jgi:hypothetical protein